MVIDKIKNLSMMGILFLSIGVSITSSIAITSIMSLLFNGRVQSDYLISAIICSAFVSWVVVFVILKSTKEIRASEAKVRDKNNELRKALAEIKILRGIIPICSYCKKVRNDQGYWDKLEVFIHTHSDAQFSHGVCPECAARVMKEFDEESSEKTPV